MSVVRPWTVLGRALAAGVIGGSLVGVAILAAPARAWQPSLGGSGISLDADPVGPGQTSIVGVVGFGAPMEASPVALTMRPLSAYLTDGQGHQVPVSRLEWAFRRHPSDALSFRPLENTTLTVYQGTGNWVGEVVFRFRPTWTDVASQNPYQLAIDYTMTATSVDTTPVVAYPDPYDVRSGQSLSLYLYRPAAGAVSVAVWKQSTGPCDANPAATRGRIFSVQPGWSRIEWSRSWADFPLKTAGFYCYAVSDPFTLRTVGGGALEAVDGSPAAVLSVKVTGGAGEQPVPGALVAVEERGKGVGRLSITGEDGIVRFAGLPAGHYRIGAQAPGYRPAQQEVRLPADPAVAVDPVRLHLVPERGPRLALAMRPVPGRERVVIGDVVEVELTLAGAPGAGAARVELQFEPGLLPLPGSWRSSDAGQVTAAPHGLVWGLEAPVNGRTAILAVRAVVTPLAAGRSEVVATATGSLLGSPAPLSLETATARLRLGEAAGRPGLIVGRIEGSAPEAGVPLHVVAEDGSFAVAGDGGTFAMALPAGLHVLRLEPAISHPGSQARGGRPVVVAVEPGVIVPVVLSAPGQEEGGAEGVWEVAAISAGRLEWAQGSDFGGDLGITLEVKGPGALTRISGRTAFSEGSPLDNACIESVVFASGGHLVAIGNLGRLAEPAPASAETRRTAPLGDAVGLSPLPGRGVVWRWSPGTAGAAEGDVQRELTAFWSLDHGQEANEDGRHARQPLAAVRAADAGPQGRVWAGVQLGPQGSADDGTAWVAGAGWDGPIGRGRAAVELLQGSGGSGWGVRLEGTPVADTVDPPSELSLRHLNGSLAARELSLFRLEGASAPGVPRTEVEWRLGLGSEESVVRGVGFGASSSGATDVYALLDMALPWGEGGGPSAPGPVLAKNRIGGVLDGAARVHPYAETAVALPSFRLGSTQISAGGALRAAGRRLTADRPVEVWTEVAARPRQALSVSARATVEAGRDPDGRLTTPQLRLRGEITPSRAVRLSTQAAAASARLQWEQVTASYSGPSSRVDLRVTPKYAEAEALFRSPAGRAGGAAAALPWWRLSVSGRWPTRPQEPGSRMRLHGVWASGPVAAGAEAKREDGLSELSASASAQRGELAVYASVLRREVADAAPGDRVETSWVSAGTRGPLGSDWGWFAEAAGALVRGRALELYRGAQAAAGLYVRLPAEDGALLAELGWRVLSHLPEMEHPERLAPELQPGLFVRLTGWWTERYNMP